jgi:nicotinamide phosphoribosyltransferase
LPVVIKAVPEGTVVPVKNVLVTIVNTDPACWWLPSFLETALVRAVWYPTTVATNSHFCKQIILGALKTSSDDLSQISFKLHDFGGRGVSSHESAAIGGAAHLVNFMGTDTIEGILAARTYYSAPMAGFSIPAAEHSTMTSWGKDNEVEAYRNMLKLFAKPGSIVAVVSDSYDIMNAASNIWGGILKEDVIKSGATIVVRPDSGNPLTVPVDVVRVLAEKFGYTINSKGYKVLPSCVRVIQGDGITPETLPQILDNLLAAGFAADNIAFGMGGGLLQQLNRDTQRFAMKCSAVCVNGAWRDVYKDPVTDHGKISKRGQLALISSENGLKTVPLANNTDEDLLIYVWRDGVLLRDWTFEEVRERSNRG